MAIYDLFIPIAVGGVMIGLATVIIHACATYERGCTLDDYLREHPDCKVGGGVKCFHCGGRGVHLRTAGRVMGAVLNSHVCRTCGRELYRSRT